MIGSVVVQARASRRRGREGKYGDGTMSESERSRRSVCRRIQAGIAFLLRPLWIYFCGVQAYSRPPDRFSNEFREGVEGSGKRGEERERERGVQADRKRGEGGRSRSKGRLVIPRVPPANSNNRESSSIATGPSLTREANPK